MLYHYFFQELDDPSLTPPLVILDHAQILREIMTVYQSSLLGEDDLDREGPPAEQAAGSQQEARTAGFRRILDVMVDPAVEMCTAAGEEKKRVRRAWDRDVFVLNCLTYLQVRRSFAARCVPR